MTISNWLSARASVLPLDGPEYSGPDWLTPAPVLNIVRGKHSLVREESTQCQPGQPGPAETCRVQPESGEWPGANIVSFRVRPDKIQGTYLFIQVDHHRVSTGM